MKLKPSKKIFSIAFILFFIIIEAQNSSDTIIHQDAVQTVYSLPLKDVDSLKRMDSLWYTGFYFKNNGAEMWNPESDSSSGPTANISIDTLILKEQIKKLNERTAIEITYHPALVKTLRFFLSKRKASLEKMFGVAETYYYPMFEEKLMKEGVPLEIKHLPIIESALNSKAKSRMGAVGLWQFMYFTGKKYGLEMTSYLDERQSPELSTEAAAKHLKDLYEIFKDWNLALAAYNSGAGNVTRAIRRSGGYKNYWNLRPFLPRETSGYLPNFLAVMILYEYKNYYGIQPKYPGYEFVKTDTIHIKHSISFDQLTELLPVTKEELEFLNPEYKLGVIPYVESQQYTLRLPYSVAGIFAANEDFIYQYVKQQWAQKEKPLPKFYVVPEYVIYRVKPGDYLGKIARKYRTSVRNIKRWNHLRSDRLRVGQRLKIYRKTPVYTSYPKKTKNNKTNHTGNKKWVYHTIQKGDTLWGISRKYSVSVKDLKRWNKLKSTQLKPGKKLKIFKS